MVGHHPVTAAAIEAYLSRWRRDFIASHGRPPRPATTKGQITALRSFFAYLVRMDLLRGDTGERLPNPMLAVDVPRVPQRSNDWLGRDEQRQLLAAAESPHERIIIPLLRWTGIRVGEAVGLQVGDVDWWSGEGALRVRRSKTDAGLRSIPIIPDLVPELQRWSIHLRETGRDPEGLSISLDASRIGDEVDLRLASGQACRGACRRSADRLHMSDEYVASQPRVPSFAVRREPLERLSAYFAPHFRNGPVEPRSED